MLQLVNRTTFSAIISVLPDRAGVDTLFVLVKATFDLATGTPVLSSEQQPIAAEAKHYDTPENSSLKIASEIHLNKLSTDVLLVGDAWAPEQKPVASLPVTVRLGSIAKYIRIHGDRTWVRKGTALVPSAPTNFVRMPLRYERAFGGTYQDPQRKIALFDPRNPVGCGFRGDRDARLLEGQPVPNLEDPTAPIAAVGDQNVVAGVGPIAATWEPRKAYAGTYDAAWQRTRAPFLPTDFDPRFFNLAPSDMIYPGFVRGGEPVELINVASHSALRFVLPTVRPATVVALDHKRVRPDMNLETVLFEPNESRMSLLWRGAVACDKRALRVREVVIAAVP